MLDLIFDILLLSIEVISLILQIKEYKANNRATNAVVIIIIITYEPVSRSRYYYATKSDGMSIAFLGPTSVFLFQKYNLTTHRAKTSPRA